MITLVEQTLFVRPKDIKLRVNAYQEWLAILKLNATLKNPSHDQNVQQILNAHHNLHVSVNDVKIHVSIATFVQESKHAQFSIHFL